MSKSVLHIVFIFSFLSAFAQQNLVPNGSFEEYYNCPNYIDGFNITSCKDWMMPTTGSPDYFNSCSTEFDNLQNTLLFSVPQNYEGYQHARTGFAYGGYYAALTPSNNNYYEYLSVRLISPLEADKSYKLTYYLSLADSTYGPQNYLQYVNHTAAAITSNYYTSSNFDLIPQTPQIVSDPTVFLNDSTGWQKVEGFYTANGGEEYLTIGYFCLYDDLVYNYLPSAMADSGIAAYFYIDDVSLLEFDVSTLIPNVFTPNGDGINDTFSFDTSIVQAEELIVLNRWGNIVFQSNNSFFWDGKSTNGDACTGGVYYYIITTKRKKINGFMSLVR